MRRLKIFLQSVLLPVCIVALLAVLFHSVYYKDNQMNFLLMWICIGIPFGIRRMFLWLVPHKYDLAGTVGVFALDVILGGIIGGFALIFQILGGVIETVKG